MYADEQINVQQSTFLFIIFVWNHPQKNKKVKISQHVYAFTKGYQTSSLNIKFAH